jgi:hypothetical protein
MGGCFAKSIKGRQQGTAADRRPWPRRREGLAPATGPTTDEVATWWAFWSLMNRHHAPEREMPVVPDIETVPGDPEGDGMVAAATAFAALVERHRRDQPTTREWLRMQRSQTVTAGCEARGSAQGSLFHPGVTGRGGPDG